MRTNSNNKAKPVSGWNRKTYQTGGNKDVKLFDKKLLRYRRRDLKGVRKVI